MFEAILWVLGEGLNLVKLLVTLYTVFFIILISTVSDDTDMRLEPVTTFDKRKKTTSKSFVNKL